MDVGIGGGRQEPSPLSLPTFTAPSLTPKALGGLAAPEGSTNLQILMENYQSKRVI